VKIAMAASIEASSKGNASAAALIAGTASVNDRRARIAAEGSTASTHRSAGSYDPAPAPTLTTLRPAPRC